MPSLSAARFHSVGTMGGVTLNPTFRVLGVLRYLLSYVFIGTLIAVGTRLSLPLYLAAERWLSRSLGLSDQFIFVIGTFVVHELVVRRIPSWKH